MALHHVRYVFSVIFIQSTWNVFLRRHLNLYMKRIKMCFTARFVH